MTMLQYSTILLCAIFIACSSDVRSQGIGLGLLKSLFSQKGRTTTVSNESISEFNQTTTAVAYDSWTDRVNHVESEVIDFRNRTNDVNETLYKIYQKELLATQEISRISDEIKKIQIIAPILILLRALKPVFSNIIARIL